MLIGKVWIHRLLFVILFVILVMDFSAEDKASSIKFCMVVHRRPGQGISHFGEISQEAPPEAQNGIYASVQFVWGLNTRGPCVCQFV